VSKENSNLFRALLHFLILAGFAASAPAQVYKWVDERGVTHYGERPPQGTKASEVPDRLGSPGVARPIQATPPGSPPSSAPVQEEKADEARRPDQCDTQKELLARLMQSAQSDGRVQAETSDAIARQKKLVAEQCKGR